MSRYSNLPSVTFNEVSEETAETTTTTLTTTNIQTYNWKEIPSKALLASYNKHKDKFNNINYKKKTSMEDNYQ